MACSRPGRGTLGRGHSTPGRMGSAVNDADRHLLTIFSAALERDPAGERAAYLDEACAGAPDLRDRVEALLRAHGQPGRFLEPAETAATVDSAGRPPAAAAEADRLATTPRPRAPARRSARTGSSRSSARAAWAPSTWPSRRRPCSGPSP